MGTFILWIGLTMIFTYLMSVHGFFVEAKGLKHEPGYDDIKQGGYLWFAIGILFLIISFFIK
jgi:hypothetical protein